MKSSIKKGEKKTTESQVPQTGDISMTLSTVNAKS